MARIHGLLVIVRTPCCVQIDLARPRVRAAIRPKPQRLHHQPARSVVIARFYSRKPRTHRGLEGLINDPHGSQLRHQHRSALARAAAAAPAELGLPAGHRTLDPVVPNTSPI